MIGNCANLQNMEGFQSRKKRGELIKQSLGLLHVVKLRSLYLPFVIHATANTG